MQRQNNKNTQPKIKNQRSDKKKIGIVVSVYNNDVTYPIRDGAIDILKKVGVLEKNIFVIDAPGAFEIPILCQKIIQAKPNGRSSNKLDGVIAIGCVIKGDTDHYHFIAQEATRGIMEVMLQTGIPITNAILTVNNLKQALDRSRGTMNKGIEAAEALISII